MEVFILYLIGLCFVAVVAVSFCPVKEPLLFAYALLIFILAGLVGWMGTATGPVVYWLVLAAFIGGLVDVSCGTIFGFDREGWRG